jgi:hypothetical protein
LIAGASARISLLILKSELRELDDKRAIPFGSTFGPLVDLG